MKTKSQKQVRYLMSSVSPLNPKQKAKLRSELRSKKVRIRKGK